MKKLANLFAAKRAVNLNTEFARKRLEKSMPGETASLASLRYGGMAV